MPEDFENTLLKWIDSQGLFAGCGRVLLAVSGGADSVAMAHALCRLRDTGRLDCDFVIGHVNHCLRGADSDGDEAFVQTLGRQMQIPVVSERVDVPGYANRHKLSIETAARRCRLTRLAKMARRSTCDRIGTAHHADDQAETLVHRLMRGTGLRGLCGIQPVSAVYGAVFVRPLLMTRRDEVMGYCRQNGLVWREDASNRDWAFTRNRIRHGLLAARQLESNCLTERFLKLSQAAQRLSVRIEARVQELMEKSQLETGPDCVMLSSDDLRDCPPWIFYELIRNVLVRMDVGLRKYTQTHVERIHALLNQRQAEISMPGAIQVCMRKGVLGFYRKTPSSARCPQSLHLDMGGAIQFGPWRIASTLLKRDGVDWDECLKNKDAQVEWFDAEKITGPLTVRCRREGDRFRPIGGKGEKKAALFLKDGQFDTDTRNDAFVIEDTQKILWLVPVRMSEAAKVTGQTKRILEIKVSWKA